MSRELQPTFPTGAAALALRGCWLRVGTRATTLLIPNLSSIADEVVKMELSQCEAVRYPPVLGLVRYFYNKRKWIDSMVADGTDGFSPAFLGGHANNALDDRDAFKARKQIPDSQYDNAEERKVYEEVENPAAVHCGDDVAPDHAGEPETVERADERPK